MQHTLGHILHTLNNIFQQNRQVGAGGLLVLGGSTLLVLALDIQHLKKKTERERKIAHIKNRKGNIYVTEWRWCLPAANFSKANTAPLYSDLIHNNMNVWRAVVAVKRAESTERKGK